MDLRTQVANLRPVAAAPAAKPGGSPAPTACAPDAPVAPTKNETGSLLEGSFSVGEQQPGVMFDPGSTAKVMAFPYAHFLSVEGTAQELEILFSTHKATVKGLRLLLVMESLRAQTLKRLSVLPKRYEPLAQEK